MRRALPLGSGTTPAVSWSRSMPGRLVETEEACPARDALDAERVAELVEVDVAGLLEGAARRATGPWPPGRQQRKTSPWITVDPPQLDRLGVG